MTLSIMNSNGFLMILRWIHFFFGIVWIGHLYYLNFAQGPFMAMAETDASTKGVLTRGLLPKVLWWFRWGAMFTFLSGWIYLGVRGHELGAAFLQSSYGLLILTGAILASLMWFNVWFVIWPRQKRIIASSEAVKAGQPADPEVASGALAARATVASRTNVFYSMPMLFFMGAASHLPLANYHVGMVGPYFIALTLILALIQLNVHKGKTGPLTTCKGVIHMGLFFIIVLYGLVEVMGKVVPQPGAVASETAAVTQETSVTQ